MTADIKAFKTGDAEVSWLADIIDGNFAPDESLAIVEAGCGRNWKLQLGTRKARVIGVDLSQEALEHRRDEVGDLDEAILGDITSVKLPAEQYDVVYSAYVLEHVRNVESALHNFDTWTRPGGLVVLRLPDRDTVFGFVARYTPYRTHIWFYKYLFGQKEAGKNGRAPFPTVYEYSMSRPGLREFFEARGYTLLGSSICRPFPARNGLVWDAIRGAMRLIGKLSGGRLAGDHNNFSLAFRKALS